MTATILRPRSASPSPALPFEAWREAAACRGRTDVFFPPQGERPERRKRREDQARSICRACPVLEACRVEARKQREYGFWGGESEHDRAAAGYPVALPTGRVARHIHLLREAARTA